MTSGAVASPVAVAHVPIDVLRLDPANPRRISDDELEALTVARAEALDALGDTDGAATIPERRLIDALAP